MDHHEEEGEADSFVGQGPGSSQAAPFLFSASPAPSDPFGQIRQPAPGIAPLGGDIRGTPVAMVPPLSQAPSPMFPPQPSMSTPRGPGSNMYRMAGPPRHARPPVGTYATSTPSQFTPGGPPTMMGTPMSTPMSAPMSMPISAPMSMPMSAPMSAPPVPGMTAPGSTMAPPMSTAPSYTSGGFAAPVSSPTGPQTDYMVPQVTYSPPQYHWFYCFKAELKEFWRPFSFMDSHNLEDAFLSGQQNRQLVSVEGGRYDVNIIERKRSAIYWEEEDSKVMRCSWFYKPEGDTRFAPYNEEFAEKLETEYRKVLASSAWHKAIEFPGEETIVIHSPQVIVHYRANSLLDEFGTTQGDQFRPRVVKRGIEEFEGIPFGESPTVDHLVLVVHGIGSTCDLRFRNIVECVDDFRRIGQEMLGSHFSQYQQEGRIGRVEFLPVRWHAALHGDATGVDKKLKAITLNSISKLRHYTNDTLLDILFYTSPAYCQTIADTVSSEMNRLYSIFCTRNPHFQGQVSVVGHSLGSLILFDLLSHQRAPGMPDPEMEPTCSGDMENVSRSTTPSSHIEEVNEGTESGHEKEEDSSTTLESMLQRLSLTEYLDNFKKEHIDLESLMMCEDSDIKEMGIPLGPRRKLQGYLKLHKKRQSKKRDEGERKAKQERRSVEPTPPSQPVAPLQQPYHDPLLRQASNTTVSFVVGGAGIGVPLVRYPQLTFSPAHFFALGSPIAMFFTVRGLDSLGEEFHLPTCPNVFNIFHPFDPVAYRIEPLITPMCPPKPYMMPHHKGRKRLHLELKESLVRMGTDLKQKIMDSLRGTWKYMNDFARAHRTTPEEVVQQEVNNMLSTVASESDELETGSIMSDMPEEDIMLGQLNQGRRVDFVLQESPIESFNEYLFALGSHGCYWESEDTVLMILKEIYGIYGMFPRRPGQTPVSPPSMPNLPPPGAAKLSSPPGGYPQNSPFMPTSFSPSYNASPVMAPPPGATFGGPVAPPPKTGFVRK